MAVVLRMAPPPSLILISSASLTDSTSIFPASPHEPNTEVVTDRTRHSIQDAIAKSASASGHRNRIPKNAETPADVRTHRTAALIQSPRYAYPNPGYIDSQLTDSMLGGLS